MAREAAIFIFYDSTTGKVLAEKRRLDAPRYPNEIIFPSGLIEESEKGNPVATMLREVSEELGVKPIQYVQLSPHSPIYDTDQTTTRLYPFLITRWEGVVPAAVLDKGNPLVWETFEEVSRSPVATRALFAKLVMEYLDLQ